MNVHGADYSVWQDNNSTPQMVDFEKAKAAGLSFAGIKVSQANWADPDYAINWANARKYVYRMPYHFLVWDVDPRKQAETFWSLLERDTYALLPLMCDFEWWGTIPSNAMDILYNFLERLKTLSAPLPLGIYTAKTFWDPNGSTAYYWRQYHLWLCDIYGEVPVPEPWDRWKFWQYTFKLDGPKYGAESSGLDGDWYNGDLLEMRFEYNLPELDVEIPAPLPEPSAPSPSPGTGWTFEALVEGQIIRSGPSTSHAKVGTLHIGERNEATNLGGNNCWIEIAPNRWVAVQYNGKIYQRRIK